MSKSDDNETATIYLLDEPKAIEKKIKRAQTDSENSVHYDKEQKPGISNLIEILSALTDQTHEQVEAAYVGKGYGAFKKDVAEAIISTLEPIQQRYRQLVSEPELDDILDKGAAKHMPKPALPMKRPAKPWACSVNNFIQQVQKKRDPKVSFLLLYERCLHADFVHQLLDESALLFEFSFLAADLAGQSLVFLTEGIDFRRQSADIDGRTLTIDAVAFVAEFEGNADVEHLFIAKGRAEADHRICIGAIEGAEAKAFSPL